MRNGLGELISEKITRFLQEAEDYDLKDLYSIVIEEVERPLIELVLKKSGGNQLKAAEILGINRNTLRKKIRHLKINGARG